MRRKDYAEAIRRFQAAIDLDARAVPAYLNLGDVRVAEGNEQEAAAIWETADRGRAGPRLPRVRPARSAGRPHRQPRAVYAALPAADRGEPAGLARAPRAVAPSGRQRPPHEALDLLFAALVQNPHALSIHQAIWRALGATPSPARRSWNRYSELTQPRGLLSRSARLHALPLPQHRAALAVPALSRLEYVRRRADRAGAGQRRK